MTDTRRRNNAILLIVGGLITLFVVVFLTSPNLSEKLYQAGLNDAESVVLSLEIGSAELQIQALSEQPAELMLATIKDFSDAEFEVLGTTQRQINLRQTAQNRTNWMNNQNPEWLIRLNPSVPLTLISRMGAGDTTLDLTPFDLRDVQVDAGAGDIEVALPSPRTSYTVVWRAGAGENRLRVPEGAALEIQAFVGAGEVDLPEDLVNAGGNTWRTPNFDPEQTAIRVQFTGGAGDFELQFD